VVVVVDILMALALPVVLVVLEAAGLEQQGLLRVVQELLVKVILVE
jgi:hypothetical protein